MNFYFMPLLVLVFDLNIADEDAKEYIQNLNLVVIVSVDLLLFLLLYFLLLLLVLLFIYFIKILLIMPILPFFWIIGLLSEYLITWPLFHIFFHFNLWWPDCRNLPCYGCFGACCGLWHFAACGRWATERRLAAQIALREDDDEYFSTYYRL
mmetsp:Transcript_16969/g.21987  ORF Transcript_16969/g.21987 Transcript_16969/m.21987 type:complete len:152 (+) Transcript_16969:1076-1531(+)